MGSEQDGEGGVGWQRVGEESLEGPTRIRQENDVMDSPLPRNGGCRDDVSKSTPASQLGAPGQRLETQHLKPRQKRMNTPCCGRGWRNSHLILMPNQEVDSPPDVSTLEHIVKGTLLLRQGQSFLEYQHCTGC